MKVVIDRAGARLDFSYEVNLWEQNEEGLANAIVAPLDSSVAGIDPLSLL